MNKAGNIHIIVHNLALYIHAKNLIQLTSSHHHEHETVPRPCPAESFQSCLEHDHSYNHIQNIFKTCHFQAEFI